MAMGEQHRRLFERYVSELSAALAMARGTGKTKPPVAAHPRVLGVVIEYFFKCKRLNEAIDAAGGIEEVEPLVFVHEMLEEHIKSSGGCSLSFPISRQV